MRRMTTIAAAVIVLLALAAPVYAGLRVLSDNFNRATGIGAAVVQLGPGTYAEIRYRDMDDSYSFTAADLRLHVRYFRRDDATTRPGIGPVSPTFPSVGR